MSNHSKIYIRFVREQERVKFMRRCIANNILAPSNRRKNTDEDLCLLQQTRRFKIQETSFQRLKVESSAVWHHLSKEERHQISSIRRTVKEKLKAKFNRFSISNRVRPRSSNGPGNPKNRYHKYRYRHRKKRIFESEIRNSAKECIVNKSSYELTLADMELLLLGMNFCPTPQWSKRLEEQEWTDLVRHIRVIEWRDVFKREQLEAEATDGYKQLEDPADQSDLPNKLKFQNYNRPDEGRLSDEVRAYTENAVAKARALEGKVKRQFYGRNNLSKNLQDSLKRLATLLKSKDLIFSKSDKDGKWILCDFNDYHTILEKQLAPLVDETLSDNNIEGFLNETKYNMDRLAAKLHQNGVIGNKLLLHATGQYFDEDKHKYMCVRKRAKYFSTGKTKLAYAYPLFKTHKLGVEQIETTPILDFPTRLLQAAGNITTTRCTAMLEVILQPLSVEYCKLGVDEYCKDSGQFCRDIDKWQNLNFERVSKALGASSSQQQLHLVACDVEALYPSMPRKVVVEALFHCLRETKTTHGFSEIGINYLVKLIMHCMGSVVIKYGSSYYRQKEGIITGDNDSVSIANIACRYVTRNIHDYLSRLEIYKRFIDDIYFMYLGTTAARNRILAKITSSFKDAGLNLTVRAIDTSFPDGSAVEFLDTNFVVSKAEPLGFYMTDFVKPTAVNRLFLNGLSHHPMSVYKSIVHGECLRLRRLNEKQEHFLSALERLRTKALKSMFDKNIVENKINLAKTWKNRFQEKKKSDDNEDIPNTWASSNPHFIKLSNKDRKLVPTAMVTYRKPRSLWTHLTNFKTICHDGPEAVAQEAGSSKPCGKCALCGNRAPYKGKNAVLNVENSVKSEKGRSVKLPKQLTCKDIGIYGIRCRTCTAPTWYVGQTKNPFSTRFSGHRKIWRSAEVDDAKIDDKAQACHNDT